MNLTARVAALLIVLAALAASPGFPTATRAQEGELVEVPLNAGTVTFRPVEGMFWGVGDVACGGVGVRIKLPAGTVMCFSETGIATIDLRDAADDPLVTTILADSPGFRLVPLPLPPPSQTPPPGPPRAGSGMEADQETNVETVALAVLGFMALAGSAAAVAAVARGRGGAAGAR